jgi:hypothetical protein
MVFSFLAPVRLAQVPEHEARGQVFDSVLGESQVALVEHVKFEERAKHLRGTGRLNSRVPIAIEWSEGGRELRAEGYTKDISPKGCMAIVPQGFVVGQRMRVINLVNQVAKEGLLVWRGHEGPTGWELGIELEHSSEDFWGLDF